MSIDTEPILEKDLESFNKL